MKQHMTAACAALLALWATGAGAVTLPVPASSQVCPSPMPNVAVLVELKFDVSADGSAIDVTFPSTGYPALDAAARACVKTWKFRTEAINGQPVPQHGKQSLQFTHGTDYEPPTALQSGPCTAPQFDQMEFPGVRDPAWVRYAISANGKVIVKSLDHSSGDAAYDAFAQSCVAAWRFLPARLKGAPVEAVGQALLFPDRSGAKWKAADALYGTVPDPVSTRHECPWDAYYPPLAQRLGEEGSTIVAFTIGVDGMIRNVVVARSSGHDILDVAAVECAVHWSYAPRLKDGVLVEVPWQTRIDWQLQKPDPPPPTVAPIK
jgi:TonB family protein